MVLHGLKMKLFVDSLTGLALMWYAEKDIGKWVSWDDLASDFIARFNNMMKRKFIEETPRHDKVSLVEPQFRDKEKGSYHYTSKPPKQ